MRTVRLSWGAAGLVAGLVGLGVAHGTSHYLGRRLTPFDAIAELVIDLTPGSVTHFIIERFGSADKAFLGLMVFLIALAFFWGAGRLAANGWWAPLPLFVALGGFGALAALTREGATTSDALPSVVGTVAWIVGLSLLTDPVDRAVAEGTAGGARPPEGPAFADLDDPTRRTVLLRTALVVSVGVGTAVLGPIVGKGRRRVEQARRLLNLPATRPRLPAGVRLPGDRIAPWMTQNRDFYVIDSSFQKPAIDPARWSLRIHGMVEREVVLSYQDLLDKEVTEDWITLNCVSNPIGGDLIGNAWWSGVRIAPLLAEAGVLPGADAVLQTSEDGWTCGTPLAALTDDRQAMIAFGMNGEPLPIEHGFPARVIVPGLYGFVSATKWVVSLEVTRFDRFEAFWTQRGWDEQAPLRISSRVDVPAEGDDVPAGEVRIGGVAWAQHTGIRQVEYAVDGGPWRRADVGGVAQHPDGTPNRDTWVQWSATVDLEEGDHEVRVRAIGEDGTVQSGVERDVLPSGATGWHTRRFSAG